MTCTAHDPPAAVAPPAAPADAPTRAPRTSTRLVVTTARLGYRGPDWLDVSLQGNTRRADAGERGGHRHVGLSFAPSPGLLYPYLSKRRFQKLTPRDWPEYRANYTEEMRLSYRARRGEWERVLSWDRVVLLCFCTDPLECHRTVLAEIFAKLGATHTLGT